MVVAQRAKRTRAYDRGGLRSPEGEARQQRVRRASVLNFRVDVLGRKPSDTSDLLREELGNHVGWYGARFDEAAAAPSEYLHHPKVSGRNPQVHHTGQDEGTLKACAQEGDAWVMEGQRRIRRNADGARGGGDAICLEGYRGFGLVLTLADVPPAWRKHLKGVSLFPAKAREILVGMHSLRSKYWAS